MRPASTLKSQFGWAAMAALVNLRNVFELIVDGLDQHPLAQEQLIVEPHQAGLHVLADGSEQLDALLPQPRQQVLGQVAFISDQRAL